MIVDIKNQSSTTVSIKSIKWYYKVPKTLDSGGGSEHKDKRSNFSTPKVIEKGKDKRFATHIELKYSDKNCNSPLRAEHAKGSVRVYFQCVDDSQKTTVEHRSEWMKDEGKSWRASYKIKDNCVVVGNNNFSN